MTAAVLKEPMGVAAGAGLLGPGAPGHCAAVPSVLCTLFLLHLIPRDKRVTFSNVTRTEVRVLGRLEFKSVFSFGLAISLEKKCLPCSCGDAMFLALVACRRWQPLLPGVGLSWGMLVTPRLVHLRETALQS